ncbi:MAG: phosphodiester glycosidase family protein [Deltaproteobacteria bacterium]|nr:phosphodiester glycosidase family protein [Deltaproteobacteria bacterium]MBW2532799.1 phosphodiester glycosidase family protein [Deltaproteobacteria bacterium]
MHPTPARLSAAAAALLFGCGSQELPASQPDRGSAPPNASRAQVAATSPSQAGVSSSPPAPSSPGTALATTTPKPTAAFPPRDFEPLFDQSAKPGDGHWNPVGNAAAGDRLALGSPAMVQAVVHPHPVSRFEKLTVVAMDLTQLEVHFAPGTDDPGVDRLTADHPPGLVPKQHQEQLVVVFNGGFKPRHGHWGMMVGGETLLEPKPTGCTIALYRDGAIRIGSWPVLSAEAPQMAAYRQTPPCLVENDQVHPDLIARRERAWGGRSPKRKTRRRTALGIDASGTLLLFGMGIELGPQRLAEGMKHAGAVAAAQLDINWSWTRFLLFGTPAAGERLQVTSTLIPQMVHARFGYVEKAGFRDFFYVTRR